MDKNVIRPPGSRTWLGGLAATAAAAVLIAGCGRPGQLLTRGGFSKRSACAGLPTNHQSHRYFAVIVGAPVTKRFACANFGEPFSVRQRAGGHERWVYGKTSVGTLTFTIK